MQRKVIVDTNVYIELFNHGSYGDLVNPFQNITFLAYPVLHELWMGLKGRKEIRLLTAWRDKFIQLGRLLLPTIDTLVSIGEACLELKSAGKLDPAHPKHYNDIAIAALTHQIGATLITLNSADFELIRSVIDFDYSLP